MLILIILVAIIIAFFAGLHLYNKKRVQRLTRLAPKDLVTYQGINLVPGQKILSQIGMDRQHPIKYIGVDNQRRVVFPESKFGNQARYYLTAISSTSQLSNSRYHQDNVRAAVHIANVNSDNSMQSGRYYLVLLKNDLSNAFEIEVKIQGQDINALKQQFVLTSEQLKSLQTKIDN